MRVLQGKGAFNLHGLHGKGFYKCLWSTLAKVLHLFCCDESFSQAASCKKLLGIACTTYLDMSTWIISSYLVLMKVCDVK